MTIDPNVIIGLGGILVAGAAVVTNYLKDKHKVDIEEADRKRQAQAEEAEQRREHEIIMRQTEVEQALINTAMNYDFARDVIGNPNGGTAPQFLDRIRGILEPRDGPGDAEDEPQSS